MEKEIVVSIENENLINANLNDNEEYLNASLENDVLKLAELEGEDGATFIPNVSDDGIISWTNNKNLENPKPVNIKGENAISEKNIIGNEIIITDANETYTLKTIKVDGKTVQNGIPTPDNPIEIENVKGYRNNFDGNVETGTISATDGTNVPADNAWRSTNHIPIKELTNTININEKIFTGTVGRFYWYDENKKYISNVLIDKLPYTFTAPSNTKYFKFFILNNVADINSKVMINEGNISRPYVSYGSNYLELKANGKNFLPNNAKSKSINGLTFTINDDKSITINGTASDNTTLDLFGENREANKIIKLNQSIWFSFDKEFIDGIVIDLYKNDSEYFDYTNGNRKIEINEEVNVNSAVLTVLKGKTFFNKTIYPMIRLATIEDDTYEQFRENSILINLQNNELCNNDTLIVQNGTVKVDKNIKMLELTGEENWQFNKDIGGYFQYYIKIENAKPNGISNYFKYSLTGYVEGNKFYISTIGNFVFMHPTYQGKDIEGLENWKKFLKDMKLKGTPVIIQYEMITNEFIQLSGNCDLNAYEQHTTITNNDKLQPNMEVTYFTEFKGDQIEIPELLNKIYPINSAYISFSEEKPNILFGGDWELCETNNIGEIKVYIWKRIS